MPGQLLVHAAQQYDAPEIVEMLGLKAIVDGIQSDGMNKYYNLQGDEVFALPGGDMPWCSGYYQNRSLAANTWTTLTPIYTAGDSSMIAGNNLVIPEDGTYCLYGSGSFCNASGSMQVQVILHRGSTSVSPAVTGSGNTSIMPGFSSIVGCITGDTFEHRVLSSVAQTTLNYYDGIRFFYIIKIR